MTQSLSGGILACRHPLADTRAARVPPLNGRVMRRVAALLLFATACATVPRGSLQDPKLARLASRGPHRVVEYDVDWYDAARQRHIPAHIYAPDDGAASPVVIFSHGSDSSRLDYRYLGQHWASYGYASIHPQHEQDAPRVDYPADLKFVLDQVQRDDALPAALRGRIDRAHIAVAGHSLGAYAALAMAGMRVLFPDRTVRNFRDPRVSAAIEMSMSENFQPASYTAIAIPVLHMTGTRDWDILNRTWKRKRRVPFNSTRRDDQYLLVVGGANHSTFAEDESASTKKQHDVIRMTSILFLNAYLRGDREDLDAMRNGELARALDGLGRWKTKSLAGLRVGKVTVHTAPLFSEEEAGHGALYRAVDVISVRTPEELIRQFLLFREGDEFDREKLSESERNLRAFDFLKDVTIASSAPHDGVVDVDVTTQDAFTTNVDLDFSNDGGRSLYDIAATQLDLFGRGTSIGIRTNHGRERNINLLEFIDPTTFGRYWTADAMLAKNSDGNEEKVAINRPLFSSTTHFTAAALGDHLLQTTHIYANAATAGLFTQEHREAMLLLGPSLSTEGGTNVRLLAGVDFLSDTFAPQLGAPPNDRRFHFAQIGFDSTHFDLLKETHVDFGLRQQDFNLGLHTSADVGRSVPNVWRFRTDDSAGYRFGPHAFVIARFAASTRSGKTNRDAIITADTKGVVKFATGLPMTLVARVRLDAGWQLDRDVQFFADGQNGLRAYPNFAFEGGRRVLVNVEDRVFLGRELWQVFEPGAAIFADNAWLLGYHGDVGAGLRFSIPRYDDAIIRFDAAYALTGSPISKRGLVFTIATTQAF